MNRRRRREDDSTKNISMITFSILIVIAIIAFIVSYMLYSKKLASNNENSSLTNNTQKVAMAESNSTMMNMIGNTEEASSSMGKSVNELQNTIENSTTNTNVEKIAVNTSSAEQKVTENKQINNKTENTIENNSKEEVTKVLSFIKPVDGDKIKDFSKDNLVYSNTLDEWTTHLGIDFAANKTDVVKATADGKIKSIKNDPRYGLTVVIEHADGFESIYSSLLTAEFIQVGEEIKQGQTIATVGNTARFEIADPTHIHFEIKKDGLNVDPNIYIK